MLAELALRVRFLKKNEVGPDDDADLV